MTTLDTLETRYAPMRDALGRVALARLPTPVSEQRLADRDAGPAVWIKHDDRSAVAYGGNKVRKLEYLFGRIARHHCERVATFGTVASNHALATAIYARELGYEPISFLAHQTVTEHARAALNMHIELGSELVPWRGDYARRIRVERAHLWHRHAAVIPAGGSSWTGCIGFVNAGLELAAQVRAGLLPCPERVYVATGTMGTAAGLALGFSLASLPVELHAVRVSHTSIANRTVLERLMKKTCLMLNRLDAAFPADLHEQSRVVLRHEFFGPGYAKTTPAVDAAIDTARAKAGLVLEPTYTGKAMCALLRDMPDCARRGGGQLFWHTWSSRPLPVATDEPLDASVLPAEFLRYFD